MSFLKQTIFNVFYISTSLQWIVNAFERPFPTDGVRSTIRESFPPAREKFRAENSHLGMQVEAPEALKILFISWEAGQMWRKATPRE